MKLSEKHYKSIIAEAMDEFAMLEKGRKDHPEDDNDHKKQGQKDTVSKSDQQLIRRKIKNKQGRNIINVTAIADELPYTQSMINRCINGKVHNGTEGEVEYKMPTDMARGIEAYLKRQVAEGKVASIMKQVLNEMSSLVGTAIELKSPAFLDGKPFDGNAYFMSGYQDPSVKGQLWACRFEDNLGTCLIKLTDENGEPIVYPEYAGQSCRLKGSTLTFTQD